jgi:hypothetical protein
MPSYADGESTKSIKHMEPTVENWVDPTKSPMVVPSGSARFAKLGLLAAGIGVVAAVWLGSTRGTRSFGDAPGPSTSHDMRTAELELTIVASPSNATIHIDDAPVDGNPFVGRFPKDRSTHLVRAEADGFVAQNRQLTWQGDEKVEFSLVETAPLEAGRAPSNAGADATPRAPPAKGTSQLGRPPPGAGTPKIDDKNPFR